MPHKIDSKSISGYSIENISIINSVFNRSEDYNKSVKIKNDVSLSVEKTITDSIAKCMLTVFCVSKNKNGDVIANAEISILGIFKKINPIPSIPIENFARINSFAILYPFIREHLVSLSLKAGMDIIMLPSVNFSAFIEQTKNK